MRNLLELAGAWRILLLAVVIFGLAPGVVLRLVVRAYPRGHSRREELVAELYAIDMAMRPFWVAQQFETALFEGLPTRWQARRKSPPARPSIRRVLRASQIDDQLVVLGNELASTKRRLLSRWFLLGTMSPQVPAINALLDQIEQFSAITSRRTRRQEFKMIVLASQSLEQHGGFDHRSDARMAGLPAF